MIPERPTEYAFGSDRSDSGIDQHRLMLETQIENDRKRLAGIEILMRDTYELRNSFDGFMRVFSECQLLKVRIAANTQRLGLLNAPELLQMHSTDYFLGALIKHFEGPPNHE
jgi:hypothetical protein